MWLPLDARLAGVAQALGQVGNKEGLGQVLAMAQDIRDEDNRAHALAAVAQALAQVMSEGDVEVARWTVEAFQEARERGRRDVWRHIEAFAPVLGKLGVIKKTWERIGWIEEMVMVAS